MFDFLHQHTDILCEMATDMFSMWDWWELLGVYTERWTKTMSWRPQKAVGSGVDSQWNWQYEQQEVICFSVNITNIAYIYKFTNL